MGKRNNELQDNNFKPKNSAYLEFKKFH